MRAINFLLLSFTIWTATATNKEGEIAIFGGGFLYSGGNPDLSYEVSDQGENPNIQVFIEILKTSSFNAVIIESIHISDSGDLILNSATIASQGEYVGDPAWPGYLQQLKEEDSTVKKIALSVSSNNTEDFVNAEKLTKAEGNSTTSILYRNFEALRTALPMVDTIDIAFPMIDDINYDNLIIGQHGLLVNLENDTIVLLCDILGYLGFKVSFNGFEWRDRWMSILDYVNQHHPGLVTHFYLPCYGVNCTHEPIAWQVNIDTIGSNTIIIPGLQVENLGGDYPREMAEKFQTWASDGINGGFVWLFDNIFFGGPGVDTYADAVIKGLESEADEVLEFLEEELTIFASTTEANN